MESQPQNPEFRINHENFHPCYRVNAKILVTPKKKHTTKLQIFFMH